MPLVGWPSSAKSAITSVCSTMRCVPMYCMNTLMSKMSYSSAKFVVPARLFRVHSYTHHKKNHHGVSRQATGTQGEHDCTGLYVKAGTFSDEPSV